MILQSCKLILMLYPLGASPQIFYSTSLLRFRQILTANVSTYTVNNKPIIKQIQHKDLRINFTNDLQWNKHYLAIHHQSLSTLGLVRHTFKQISVIARKQLYISLVRSQIMYCFPLWRPQLLKDTFTLERIQRRATKLY